ncbi:MAG: glycosyltransferase [Puniceicoccales bacterium]
MMRLLNVIHSANPERGGTSEVIRLATPVLHKLGHEAATVSLDAPGAPMPDGTEIIQIGPGRGNYGHCPALDSWHDLNIKEYDAVIIHGIWQYHSFAVWRASRRLMSTPPYFVYPHGMLDPWFRRAYPIKHLKKCAYWLWAESRVLRDAGAVLFTCEEERQLARGSFWPYLLTEEIVNLGTALPEFSDAQMQQAWRGKSPLPDGEPYLVFLGRLHEKKGVDLLLEAYQALLRETRSAPALVLAGPEQDPVFAQKLKTLASGSNKIHFVGMLEGAAKWGALRDATAMILPSHQENFGIVVAEALAMATPVLITKPVNIWREVDADQAGYVEDDTPAGIRRLLQRAFDTSAAEWTTLSANAKRCFEQRFQVEKAVARMVDVIESSR